MGRGNGQERVSIRFSPFTSRVAQGCHREIVSMLPPRSLLSGYLLELQGG